MKPELPSAYSHIVPILPATPDYYGTIPSRRHLRSLKKLNEKILAARGTGSAGTSAPAIVKEPHLSSLFPVFSLTPRNSQADSSGEAVIPTESVVVIGMLRMGYGHYRTALSIASAAAAKGLTPLLFDPGWFSPELSRTMEKLNVWYARGSRIAHKSKLFNRLFWEPGTGKTFKKIDAMLRVYKAGALLLPSFMSLKTNWKFIGTHSWLSQAAGFRGMANVVNAVQDNWAQGFFLSRQGVQCVQGPASFLGYRLTLGMGNGGKDAEPIPQESLRVTGHFVDKLILDNLSRDCDARLDRADKNLPKRFLFSLGGAGAQEDLPQVIVQAMQSELKTGKAALVVNFGDHIQKWGKIQRQIARFGTDISIHRDWQEVLELFRTGPPENMRGIHVFVFDEIIPSVYATNLFIRWCDFLITKPSELAFFPVPKLHVKRLGAHEAWAAIRSSELGDGTPELTTPEQLTKTIRALLSANDILRLMVDRIIKNHAAGIYGGAQKLLDTLI